MTRSGCVGVWGVQGSAAAAAAQSVSEILHIKKTFATGVAGQETAHDATS